MSLPILTAQDFTGVLSLSLGQLSATKYDEYISYWEKFYIKDLFSGKAYIEIRDLSPLSQKYIDLINGCDWYDSGNDEYHTLTGFKEILRHWIYYRISADNFQPTPVGKRQNKNENSINVSDGANREIIYQKYNHGIELYIGELVPFINEFAILTKEIDGYIDLGGGLYEIESSDTKYLVNGDNVSINNVLYEVSNVVNDTTFQIDAGEAGLTFSGNYTYEPYKDFNLTYISRPWL